MYSRLPEFYNIQQSETPSFQTFVVSQEWRRQKKNVSKFTLQDAARDKKKRRKEQGRTGKLKNKNIIRSGIHLY